MTSATSSSGPVPPKTPAVAVAGALAYDQICRTDTSLIDSVTPLLNRKLTGIEQAYGGCAGNMAYNLARLQQPSLLISCSGRLDDEAYLKHLQDLEVDTSHCLRTADQHCARAVIFTDPNGKQFTGFYPGPVPSPDEWHQHLRSVNFSNTAIFVQAPYPTGLMQAGLAHVQQLDARPVVMFAPGQYADQLSAAEVANLVDMADWVIGNEHEIRCLQQHHPLSGQLVIRTHGAEPIAVQCPDGRQASVEVPVAMHDIDPTGCGDALVAGLCHHLVERAAEEQIDLKAIARSGLQHHMELLRAGLLAGCKLASACLAHPGSQHH